MEFEKHFYLTNILKKIKIKVYMSFHSSGFLNPFIVVWSNLNITVRIGLREKPTISTSKGFINKKSITKARNIKACYFCAKPGHIYAQCRNANQAQKNFISNLLHSGGFDFERFKKCVATEESKQAKNQGKSADEE